jgi:hypothetical protein
MSKRLVSQRTLWALVATLGMAQPSVARATEPPAAAADASSSTRIAELNEQGARAYGERNYRNAIEKFVEAYAIDHDPNLLFNLGRCYEKLGELDAAVEKYELFLATPGADTEGRIKAKISLGELSRLRERGEAQAAPARPRAVASPDFSASTSPSSHALLTWTAFGTGLVVAGVGATCYALGVRDHRQVTSSPSYGDTTLVHPMTRAEAQRYVDSGDTKKLVGGIGLGLGGALIAASVVLFVTGKPTDSAPGGSAGFSLAPGVSSLLAGYSGKF